MKAAAVPTQDSDIYWVATCLRGDRNAFMPLVERYQACIYNLCYRYTHHPEDARDLTQETFLHAFRALDRYDAAHPFRTWLFTIAANVCRDWARRKKCLPATATLLEECDAAIDDSDGDPATISVDVGDQAALAQAVTALPDAYKTPVILFYVEEMSQEEIGRILQLPVTVVKNRLYRARRMLRQALEEEQ